MKVLFVCVENSCRSQIAEAFARKLGKGALQAYSAGSKPSGKVNPTAVALMRERGLDLGANRSKGFSDLPAGPWDYVVTMGCGDACPFVPGKKHLDWDIPDPKSMLPAEFNKVIDRIENEVLKLMEDVKTGPNAKPAKRN